MSKMDMSADSYDHAFNQNGISTQIRIQSTSRKDPYLTDLISGPLKSEPVVSASQGIYNHWIQALEIIVIIKVIVKVF